MDYQSLKKILSSDNTYNGVKQYMIAIQQERMDIVQLCADVIINILNDQQGPHYPKFLCLKFINDLMELQEYEWIDITQKKILPILEEYALFKKGDQDDERGKQLFIQYSSTRKKYEQIKELEQVGYIFHRFTLESIWVWSKWFPIDTAVGKLSLYKIAQERLSIQKVKFPIISYFTTEKVINHQQIQRPPKELLQECTQLIKEHIYDGQQTDLLLFQSSLTKMYFTNQNNNLQNTITYPQILKNAIDLIKQGKLGIEISNKLKSVKINQIGKKLLQASKVQKQNRSELFDSIYNFTQIISEKEKLLQEINTHINEKELINNQLFEQKQNNQLLIQEIERLKQQNNLKQYINNDQNTNSFNQTNPNQQFESLKEQDKLLQKKDLEIKKLQDFNLHYQDIINQLNNKINLLQQIHDQGDIERFKLQQDKINSELKCEELSNQLKTAQQQIKRQNENIKQLQQQVNQLNEECLTNYDKQQNKIQQLLSDYAALAQVNQYLKDQNEQQKFEIEIYKNEKENLSTIIVKLTKNLENLQEINQAQKSSHCKLEKPYPHTKFQSQTNYEKFYQQKDSQQEGQKQFYQQNRAQIN